MQKKDPRPARLLADSPRPPVSRASLWLAVAIWGAILLVTAFTAHDVMGILLGVLCAGYMIGTGFVLTSYDKRVAQYEEQRAAWERQAIFAAKQYRPETVVMITDQHTGYEGQK